MITKKQLNILNVFREDFSYGLSLSDLKKKLRGSSNSQLQRAISDFKNENIITIKKVGRTNLIFLNYKNNKLFSYFSILDLENIDKKILKNVYEIQDSILKETEFFALIIFGSYAERKATKKSDLDLAVIVESDDVIRKMVPRINSVKRKTLRTIDYHAFTRKEFLDMLKDEKENLGKEIVRKHLVVYGGVNFYKLFLKEVNNVEFN